MFCEKCKKYLKGYRCPDCGNFILTEENAGTIYNKDMKLVGKKSALETIFVISIFAFLIGMMIWGLWPK